MAVANQNFGRVICTELQVKNGTSPIAQIKADKDGLLQINVMRRGDDGGLVNFIALDVPIGGNAVLRMTDPVTGELLVVDQTLFFPPVGTDEI